MFFWIGVFALLNPRFSYSHLSYCERQYKKPPSVREEAWGQGRWTIDGPNVSPYEDSFKTLLKKTAGFRGKYFDPLLVARKAEGKSTHVLDLMGSGYFIRNEALADSITGFRLETLPLSEAELAYWGKRPEFLGDVFSSQSWAGLDRYMLDHGIPKYDLIACRPWGAWKRFSGGTYSAEIENLTLLLSRAANRLNSTGEAWFSIYSTHVSEVFAQASRMIELKDTLRKMGFRSEIEQSAPAFIGYKVIRVEMRISPVRRYSL